MSTKIKFKGKINDLQLSCSEKIYFRMNGIHHAKLYGRQLYLSTILLSVYIFHVPTYHQNHLYAQKKEPKVPYKKK